MPKKFLIQIIWNLRLFKIKNRRNMKEKIERKSIRLKGYDYVLEGYYFITICTKNKEEILSKIIEKSGLVKTNPLKSTRLI